jgi:hypothetical protein
MSRVNLFGSVRDAGETPYCDRCSRPSPVRYLVRVGELRLKVCIPCSRVIDKEKSARADVAATKEAA